MGLWGKEFVSDDSDLTIKTYMNLNFSLQNEGLSGLFQFLRLM